MRSPLQSSYFPSTTTLIIIPLLACSIYQYFQTLFLFLDSLSFDPDREAARVSHLGPMVGEPRTLHLPLDNRIKVTMQFSDTSAYDFSTPNGRKAWKASYPPGGGSVRLGHSSSSSTAANDTRREETAESEDTDTDRAVFLSMYHQLHCVETFAKVLFQPKSESKTKYKRETKSQTRAHLQHCLNFLREIALCRPDLTLERGDVFADISDSTKSGRSSTRVCRDAGHIREVVSENYKNWIQRKEEMEREGSRILL
ncbi:hypothetical protein D9613_001183 [Agrocybe pediades]|uniref:Uncharacterized protein n=1 Tax=Agrocybe pediades TaxID=84607 RepID=A0A8H4R090_9AGAR|nr:hypothetical protein D9613_001183 [Agrocybe pediades]